MRAVVLLCLLEAAFIQAQYEWDDPDAEPDNSTECLSDQMSCGCCLMQDKLRRTEDMFNFVFQEMHDEITKAKVVVDHMAGNRSAFSVSLNNASGLNCYGPFNQDNRINYTHAFINMKNHYNQQTGIFTVPYKGTYSISVTIYAKTNANSNLDACASLQVNGNVVSELHDDNGQDIEDSSTVVMAMELDDGDQVSVNLPKGCVLCDDHNHYNTFTGFLLYSH